VAVSANTGLFYYYIMIFL